MVLKLALLRVIASGRTMWLHGMLWDESVSFGQFYVILNGSWSSRTKSDGKAAKETFCLLLK
jgi:hypothetical protein